MILRVGVTMFGLKEHELDRYIAITQDFAVQDVTPLVISNSKFITPLLRENDKKYPDADFVIDLIADVETIITLTATHIAYEYAYLQSELEQKEEDIIKHLHTKNEDYLISLFIKYGISFTEDVLIEIIGGVILELPYLYGAVLMDENFDEDKFLEEKLEAYNQYLNENFPKMMTETELEDEEGFEGLDDFED
jgi:hypothetical protein